MQPCGPHLHFVPHHMACIKHTIFIKRRIMSGPLIYDLGVTPATLLMKFRKQLGLKLRINPIVPLGMRSSHLGILLDNRTISCQMELYTTLHHRIVHERATVEEPKSYIVSFSQKYVFGVQDHI